MDKVENRSCDGGQNESRMEVNLIDLAIMLAKHKKLILGVPLLVALVVLGVSLVMSNIYIGTTRLLPPLQQQSSAAAMLGQLGLITGTGAMLGLKRPSDLYVGMLSSRTVADNIINRFDLKRRYGVETYDDVRKILKTKTDITVGDDGIIVLAAEDADPKFAADLANAYVDELYKLTQNLAVTEASQRRLFYEKQLKMAKDQLAAAEVSLKEAQETTGVLELSEQGRAMIAAITEIRAQIATKEIELMSMRTFATDQNQNYKRAQSELVGLRNQLKKLEVGGDNGFVSTRKLPQAGLEYIRKMRDVKYYEALFEILAKQYEMARFDEAKDSSVIQVLDKAVVPELYSKPKRPLMVLVSAFAVGVVCVLWVFLKEASNNARTNSEYSRRLDQLNEYMKWR